MMNTRDKFFDDPNRGEVLGEGWEKTVHEDPKHPDRVVAVLKREDESPNQLRARYYLTKILHLLSSAIPDAITGVNLKDRSFTFERVKYNIEEHKILQKCDSILIEDGHLPPKLERMYVDFCGRVAENPDYQTLKQLLSDLKIEFDGYKISNFAFDEDDNFKYLDNDFRVSKHNQLEGRHLPLFDIVELKRAIDNLPEVSHVEALKYYDRLYYFMKKDNAEFNEI